MENHDEGKRHGNTSFFNKYQKYLGEVVYGGIDGSVTTFAVVAGASGAGLNSGVILVLGFANLFADGFSMSVGAFLSSKSEQQNFEKHKATEYWEVDNIPETEREEIRQIYREKGFEGKLLEDVVEVITSDRDRWVDTMMKEELEMMKEQRAPFWIGAATFASFLVVGIVPLVVYVWDYAAGLDGDLFWLSALFTSLAFLGIGYLKTYVTQTSRWKGMLETFLLGAMAAAMAYYVGDFLEKLVG